MTDDAKIALVIIGVVTAVISISVGAGLQGTSKGQRRCVAALARATTARDTIGVLLLDNRCTTAIVNAERTP